VNWGISNESQQVLIAFGAYLVGVLIMGLISHRYLRRGKFVAEYFLGNRGLGPWVLALTVAATAVSGGTFMGFPSLIYTNGWVMALWIASYMVVPLTSMALMGKRLNQVARIAGAITVPDVLRDRFASPALGLLATCLILVFLTVNLVAQFKGGGLVLKEAMRLPPGDVVLPLLGWPVDRGYLVGLAIFACTVIAYTTYGGFWAVTWTDVLEGLVMLLGVVLMAVLAVRAVPPLEVDGAVLTGLAAATERLRQADPVLVCGPGPGNFLPLGLAFSFFCMWSLMAAGQPSGMVRLMSFKDTPSLRRAMMFVVVYYGLTYILLVLIFVCARAIFPTEYLKDQGSEGQPDSIMPAMIRYLTRGAPWVGGILLAAPYAAIMSTVAAFLLMISSSLVRDIYQRTINPHAPDWAMKLASYVVTASVGLLACFFALRPPAFLQYIIVFSASGLGCSFLVPMLLSLYWPRATKQGVLASMLAGLLTLVLLYILGWLESAGVRPFSAAPPPVWAQWLGYGQHRFDAFAPLYVLGLDPLVWGLSTSLVLGVGVSLATRPDPHLVARYFPTP
jgi:SSS family transporter